MRFGKRANASMVRELKAKCEALGYTKNPVCRVCDNEIEPRGWTEHVARCGMYPRVLGKEHPPVGRATEGLGEGRGPRPAA